MLLLTIFLFAVLGVRAHRCLQIHVYGFDHKAPLMLREVLKRLLDLGPHLQEGATQIHATNIVKVPGVTPSRTLGSPWGLYLHRTLI